ncbi:MAG: phosphopantothenoylcysteine decarboxylase [Candidatus Omnitrophota bacterium]
MRVLITCGPTWVAIDDVRVISNHSTGEMGHLIAQFFIDSGAQVTLLEGQVTHSWAHQSVKLIKYRFFDELQKLLKVELEEKYDCVIHAAAVSDFNLAKTAKGKVDSAKSLVLSLIPATKLINDIKKTAPKVFLVGFKLEPNLKESKIEQETRGLFDKAHCDLVVANSVDGGYRGFVVDARAKVLAKAVSKIVLAKFLVKNILGLKTISPVTRVL